MSIKDRFEKVELFFQVEEKLKEKNLELEEVKKELNDKRIELETEINSRKSELEKINEQISTKTSELSSLKTEVVDLRAFINQKFMEEFKEYDYKVDITNAYIISFHGKKYIAIKYCDHVRSDRSTLATGYYNVEIYSYYDVLNIKDNKSRLILEYRYCYDDFHYFSSKTIGTPPDYEERLLEAYPELSIFADNQVPNTYLKKIYYEANELGNKKLIKDAKEQKDNN